MATTDLATIDDNESALQVLPPQRPPAEAARAMLHAHAQMMSDAYKLAVPLVKTSMVPARFKNKEEDATAAILYGAELGLNPIQSLQRIIPIHGMPSLEARTMVALLKSRGYKIKTTAQSDESVTVEGWDLDGEHYTSTWTIERARRAGYVPTPIGGSKQRPEVDDDWVTVTKMWDGKAKKSVVGNMKYITDPQAMLKAKAQAEICREMAPDVLLGISYTREELESERFDEQPAPAAAVDKRSAPITVDEIMTPAATNEPAEPKKGAEGEGQRAEAVDRAKTQLAADGAQTQPASDIVEKPIPADVTEPAAPEPVRARSVEEDKAIRHIFALLKKGKITDHDDRIEVYRAILNNPAVASTDDLTGEEIGRVETMLADWDRRRTLNTHIEDIVRQADFRAQNEAEADSPEGN